MRVKNSTEKKIFNHLVLHTIICRRKLLQKRRDMWVKPINVKRLEFNQLCQDLLEDEDKFCVFFRTNVEQFYRLSQSIIVWWSSTVRINVSTVISQTTTAIATRDHWRPTDEDETCGINTADSRRLFGLDSTLTVCQHFSAWPL